MCTLNGRLCPENDNFTCVRTNGSSVVDYICTFHDNLSNCIFFKVHLARQLLDSLNVFERVIPDHSILELDFVPHFNAKKHTDNFNTEQNTSDINEGNIQQNTVGNIDDECTARYFKRYKIRNMSVNFLESDIACQAILHCIENIEHTQAIQGEIDVMYENVCNVYYNEMDVWFKFHNVNKVSDTVLNHFGMKNYLTYGKSCVKQSLIICAVVKILELEEPC